MNRIRAGLYSKEYEINDETKVEYQTERNTGFFNGDNGKWFIRTRIIQNGREVEHDTSTETFDTKAAAVIAIDQMAGNWSYYQGLGWCYDD